MTVPLNDHPGLDGGEAESCILDGKEEVHEEDDPSDNGEDPHDNTSSTLTLQ